MCEVFFLFFLSVYLLFVEKAGIYIQVHDLILLCLFGAQLGQNILLCFRV